MDILTFLFNLLGAPDSEALYIFYIAALILLLVLLDGIITFLISGVTSLIVRGKK